MNPAPEEPTDSLNNRLNRDMIADSEERTKRERFTEVKLSGLTTEAEWQCAYLSIPHAVKGRKALLQANGDHATAVAILRNAGRV